jgi:hypothetical protein
VEVGNKLPFWSDVKGETNGDERGRGAIGGGPGRVHFPQRRGGPVTAEGSM